MVERCIDCLQVGVHVKDVDVGQQIPFKVDFLKILPFMVLHEVKGLKMQVVESYITLAVHDLVHDQELSSFLSCLEILTND